METTQVIRHYQGILRYADEYISEQRFTIADLMELTVYAEAMIAPHELKISEEVEKLMKKVAKPKMTDQDYYNLRDDISEKCHMDYYDLNLDYQRQTKVIDIIKVALWNLREQPPVKTVPSMPQVRPIFDLESIDVIYELLKDYFGPADQVQLKELLLTGDDAGARLLFLGQGNKLADAMKQLIKVNLITGVEKKELEAWIQRNFCYKYRGTVKEYKLRYLNDIISTNTNKCQNHILNIKLNPETGKYHIIHT